MMPCQVVSLTMIVHEMTVSNCTEVKFSGNLQHVVDENPGMVPLTVSSAVDMDSTTISTSKLTLWALANLWKEDKEGGYAIQHGRCPVSDFGHPCQGNSPTDPDR